LKAVGLFQPYERNEEKAAGTTPAATSTPTKNRPTPSRKQAQADRMKALHPKITRRQAANLDREAQEKRRQQQINAVENQPERVLLRNYVDSRWTLSEFMWPVLLILLAASLMAGRYEETHPEYIVYITGFLWAAVLATIINMWIFWRGFNRELQQRYPGTNTKGLFVVLVSRMSMVRRMRNPPAKISRGESY